MLNYDNQIQFKNFCTKMYYNKIALNSRPWNCEVQMQLNPPFYFIETHFRSEGSMYHSIWKVSNPVSTNSLDGIYSQGFELLPSELPQFYFLQVDRRVYKRLFPMGDILKTWVQNVKFTKQKTRSLNAALYLLKTTKLIYEKIKSTDWKWVIQLNICYTCMYSRNNLVIMRAWYVDDWKHFSLTSVRSNYFSTQNKQMLKIGIIDEISYSLRSHQNPAFAFRNCDVAKSRRVISLLQNPRSLTEPLVAVWQSLLYNFTCTFNDEKVKCSSRQKRIFKRVIGPLPMKLFISRHDGIGSRRVSAVALLDITHAFRFISCGNSMIKGLLFNELFSVFDVSTWFLILMGNVIFFLFSEQLIASSDLIGVLKRLLDILSIFLEQSSQTIIIFKRLSPLVAAIFLAIMGIVINGAYRNTNVYNMVTPRKIEPLEHFPQLIQFSFKVYCRTSYIQESFNLFDDYKYSECDNEYKMSVYKDSTCYILHPDINNKNSKIFEFGLTEKKISLFPKSVSILKTELKRSINGFDFFQRFSRKENEEN